MQEPIRGFRLSHQQRRLWLAGGRDPWFCAQSATALDGPCDAGRLRAAVERVIALHESLRTVFRARAGMAVPIQVVEEPREPRWRERAGAPGDLGGEGRRELLDRECRKPFDLERGPLLRPLLLTLEEERRLLVLTLPALCADRRTLDLLVAQIARAYGEGQGRLGQDEEPVQYVQFSEWEHEVLAEDDERQAYWAGRGLDAVPPLELPFQKEAGAAEPGIAPAVRVALPDRVAAALEEVAGSLRSTPELFLLACFGVLLWRYTRRDTVVVSTVADGRWFEEVDDAFGLFARALPIDLHPTWGDTFRGVLREVRSTVEDALEWQEHSVPARDGEPAGRAGGLWPFAFEFEERPAPIRAGGLLFRPLDQRAFFDRPRLKLRAILGKRERSGGGPALELELRHDPSCFEAVDVEDFARRLARLVESAVERPRARLGELGIATAGDLPARGPSARGPRDPALAGPQDTVLRRIEEQAARFPERPAVRCEDVELRFGELAARATALARRLREHGVGPEVQVPLCLDRSADMVVALLAVWKAGGCFVPMIPTQPRERLGAILEQLDAPVVLTENRWADGLPGHPGRTLTLDTFKDTREGGGIDRGQPAPADPASANHESPDPAPVDPAPANLAYVVFTSGTTGRPKGVGIEHRQLRAYLDAILERLDPPSGAAFAMVSTFAADLGYTMLFPALATGGTLHVISQERASDPAALAEYFDRHAIDCLKITPGHLAALAGEAPARILPRRRLVLGGEASRPAAVAELRAAAPQCAVFNHYGPTETTVGALTLRADEVVPDGRWRSLPIGRPLAGSRVHLVDVLSQPVPAWMPGEILIGGAGVGRGYLGRPGRTAASFVPDPFSDQPGERLYRTGDLGRRLPGGEIEFLGRIDHQVKFHGLRLELDEIRAALGRDERVRESVVLKVEDDAGREALVVYYAALREIPAGELRERLARSIPEDVLPNVFVHLPKLPYTPNGKVDAGALPTLDEVRRRQQRRYAAPRNPVEERLAAIWAEVLKLERVGIRDNYFEIGGDSIQSIRVIALAAKAGIHLEALQFFEHQTVAELAAAAATRATASPGEEAPAGEVPLTPIQRRFFEQEHREPHHWNLSFRLDVGGPAAVGALARAFAHLLDRHDALRLRFHRREGVWHQAYAGPASSAEDLPPFSHLDLSRLTAGARRAQQAAAEARLEAGLDLERGPLARGVLLGTGGEGQPARLALICHHLVVDGVSWRVLLEDFEAAYRRIVRGVKPEPAPRTSSFKSWSESLEKLARSPAVADEVSRWLDDGRLEEKLADLAPLPCDVPPAESRRDDTEGRARTVAVSLERQETRELLQEIPARHRIQVEEVLLLALAEAFARWTGRRSLLVDLEGHGREILAGDLDLSRTVGWFTSVSPLLLDLEGSRGLGERLKAVKEQRRALPCRGLGDPLLRYLNPGSPAGERLRRLPHAEVSFNFMGSLDGAVGEPFDLTVGLEILAGQRSASSPRLHAFAVNAWVLGNRLNIALTYGAERHRRETAERLVGDLVSELRALLAGEPGLHADSPSDFPLAGLDQEQFQQVASLLGELDDD